MTQKLVALCVSPNILQKLSTGTVKYVTLKLSMLVERKSEQPKCNSGDEGSIRLNDKKNQTAPNRFIFKNNMEMRVAVAVQIINSVCWWVHHKFCPFQSQDETDYISVSMITVRLT